jgi:hypothetical protein
MVETEYHPDNVKIIFVSIDSVNYSDIFARKFELSETYMYIDRARTITLIDTDPVVEHNRSSNL